MIKEKIPGILALPMVMMVSQAHAASIGPYNVDAYATSLTAVTPVAASLDVVAIGGTLAEVVTDTSVTSFVSLPGTSSYTSVSLTLGFDSNTLLNEAGADLVLFELGSPDAFDLTIGGITKTLNPTYIGMIGGISVNAAVVELGGSDNFNIALGAGVSSITVGLGAGGASFALAGGLAPVPVPAAVWMFGSGLIGLVGVARRRRA